MKENVKKTTDELINSFKKLLTENDFDVYTRLNGEKLIEAFKQFEKSNQYDFDTYTPVVHAWHAYYTALYKYVVEHYNKESANFVSHANGIIDDYVYIGYTDRMKEVCF